MFKARFFAARYTLARFFRALSVPVPLARNVTLSFRPQRTAAPTITSRTVTVTFGAV